MIADSRLARLLLVSPWFLALFCVIPLCTVLSYTYGLQLPLVGTKPLLINNTCFSLLIACRFLRYLYCLGTSLRYSSRSCVPSKSQSLSLPKDSILSTLSASGYRFKADGSYGEHRDLGYLGTTFFYGGLMLLLLVGTLDNLRQFSGTLLDGQGPATKLSKLENYRGLVRGPLTGSLDALPQMKVLNQIFPNASYPNGATEIAIMTAEGKTQSKVLRPMEVMRFGGFELFPTRFVFEPEILIRTKDGKTLSNGMLTMMPVVRSGDEYGFYAPFKGDDLEGNVYYKPSHKKMRVVMKHRGAWVLDVRWTFQEDQSVAQGDYIVSCEKLGQWTEIRVVRSRHKGLLIASGLLALLGLGLRGGYRAQRVWIEDGPAGCRVKTRGARTAKLVAELNQNQSQTA
jgi:hypothetical protein